MQKEYRFISIFISCDKGIKDYPERNYGNKINERIKEKRKALEKELLQNGYTGKYPVFSKKNTTVRVMEEQPYVTAILEWMITNISSSSWFLSAVPKSMME